jgi:AcrR family transcriptional regulator
MSGLRERKKTRTRAELQHHALRLFREQGYAATTVEQIATAAEVSRATFFRYFPNKEDVVLYDDVDPLMARAFAGQPEGTPMLSALRAALRGTFEALEPEKRELEEVRMALARAEPELRATLVQRNQFFLEQIAEWVARNTGRPVADLEVQLFAGVIVGARFAAQALADRTPRQSYIDALDAVLTRLEHGIPLADVPIRRRPS